MSDIDLYQIAIYLVILFVGFVVGYFIKFKKIKENKKKEEEEESKLELNNIWKFYEIYIEQHRFNMQSIRVITGIIFPIAILIFATLIISGGETNFFEKLSVAFISLFLMTTWYWFVKRWHFDANVLRGMIMYIEEKTNIFNIKKRRDITQWHTWGTIGQHNTYFLIMAVFSISWFFYLVLQIPDTYSINWHIFLIFILILFLVYIYSIHFHTSKDYEKGFKPEFEKDEKDNFKDFLYSLGKSK